MEPVRTVLVGVGMIGSWHAAVLARSPFADLLACCDSDPDAASRVPHGVPFVADLGEALSRPGLETVFVCTPQETHRAIVEQAIAGGAAVFCEKPIAHSLADADAMIAAAGSTDRLLAIGHALRFDPDYLALAEAVREGQIGEVVSLHARRSVPDFEGRVIASRTTLPVEVGVHDLDVLRWLGGDIERVYAEACAGLALGGELVDAVVGTIRFASGTIGTIELNWVMASETGLPSDYRLALFGTKGSAFAEYRQPAVGIYGESGVTLPRTSSLADVYGSYAGTLRTEVEHFLRSVRERRPWPVTLNDARAALAAAIALDRSAVLARPVRVAEVES